ncbi:GPW/gp25 family protein [Burkholderia stagnalis]|uniref:Phage baseplate protein n=1 Tax=Burkholderia stagnalis TaxID=1503054 RepID=A0ABX9YFK9_9BURK|nr:GPW/gp25 family protein [Burkholderia stagnalis]RQQ47909.1 phage baseplate protein [Burkholderia stagnalis]RQQ59565.1 phage baseplate protein [Burkholderia stagnalis]RQQ60019.1 phage baseplate protein [Burkholderia stagnalis]RQQ74675.1 phage baseplate protein [Burkholderia stagnalis]RQQ80260.1 phage baseplate protein [Burkholderia stagnalis]
MSIQDTETALYGQGWKFPLTFTLPRAGDPAASGVAMSAGAHNVEQSMRVLFQTQPGERIMRDAYGCDLQSAVFANLSEGTLAGLRRRILDSVARCEPRAEVLAIELQQDARREGWLRIEVTYRLAGQAQARRMSGALDMQNGTGGGF